MDVYGDRLICTHIHDNFGKGYCEDPDLHYLPFDGNIDYAVMMSKLNKCNYTGSIMLELSNTSKPEYAAMGEKEFIKEAYRRAVRLNELGK